MVMFPLNEIVRFPLTIITQLSPEEGTALGLQFVAVLKLEFVAPVHVRVVKAKDADEIDSIKRRKNIPFIGRLNPFLLEVEFIIVVVIIYFKNGKK